MAAQNIVQNFTWEDVERLENEWREERRGVHPESLPKVDEQIAKEIHEKTSRFQGPFMLTNGQGDRSLATKIMHFHHMIPHYPSTDPEGYTYCVPITSISNPKRLKMQLGHARHIPPKGCRSPFFGNNVECMRYYRRCTGIKACSRLRPELAGYEWTELTEEKLQQLQSWRDVVDVHEPNERIKAANTLFIATKNLFRKEKYCNPYLPTCRPIIHKSTNPDRTGTFHSSIRCVNYHFETGKKHYKFPISPVRIIDIEHLQTLFETVFFEPPIDYCGKWDRSRSLKQKCEADHTITEGINQIIGCNVMFNYIVPIDTERTPWVLLCSTGIHRHPPPPPNTLPEAYLQQAQEMITRCYNPGLTTAKFLSSRVVHQFQESCGARSLGEIHPGFLQRDRFTNLIRQWRFQHWPEGQDLNGVLFEYQRNHQDPELAYIQEIFTYDDKWMVFCLKKEQAEIFLDCRYFQVDMSFKRTRGKDRFEIIFAINQGNHGKVITLARVFVNYEGTETYKHAFEKVIGHAARLTGRQPKWWYLNREGWQAVVMDMSSKAVSGLGQYLHSIDNQGRSWQTNVAYVYRACSIHLRRSAEQAAGKANKKDVGEMLILETARNTGEYNQICDDCRQKTKGIGGWGQHKKQPWVASGICKAMSSMDPDIWDSIVPNTNAVEESAWKSYSYGKQLSLLEAIYTGELLDDRDLAEFNGRNNWNITHRQANVSTANNTLRYLSRQASESQKRQAEWDLENTREATRQRLSSAVSEDVFINHNWHPNGTIYRGSIPLSRQGLTASQTPSQRGVSASQTPSQRETSTSQTPARSSPILSTTEADIRQSPLQNTALLGGSQGRRGGGPSDIHRQTLENSQQQYNEQRTEEQRQRVIQQTVASNIAVMRQQYLQKLIDDFLAGTGPAPDPRMFNG